MKPSRSEVCPFVDIAHVAKRFVQVALKIAPLDFQIQRISGGFLGA